MLRTNHRLFDLLWLTLVCFTSICHCEGGCPAPEDAASMDIGEEGIKLAKNGVADRAADCFWLASERAGSEEEAAGWLKNAAQASEEAGNVEDAAEAWQQMFDMQVGLGQVPELQFMARVPTLLQQLGRIEQAMEAWGAAASMHPESGEAHANYGAFLAQMDRLEEAVEAYRLGLKFRPDLEAVHVNLVSALQALGRTQESEEASRNLHQLKGSAQQQQQQSPGYEHFQEIGLNQLNAGRLPEAEQSFLKCLQLPHGDNYAVHYNLGLVYFYGQQWDKALAHYEKSLVHNPNFSHTYHGIGNVYEVNKIFDKALEFFGKTVELDPRAADTYFNIGTVLQQMKKHEEAVPYFEKAAEISPDSSGTYVNLGVSLKALGRVTEAIDAYYNAVKRNPIPQAFGNLASALHEMGRDKEAVDVARQGVALDPNYAHGYNILGTLLRPSRGSSATGGSAEEAMKAYQTALVLAPTFVDATLNLAGLLVEDEQFDYALRVVRMARRLNDEDPRLFMEYFNLKRRVADWSHWDINLRMLASMIEAQMKVLPKLSLQPFQAEAYPVTNDLVRRVAAHFAKYAYQRSRLMLATMLGEGGAFDLSRAVAWQPGQQRLKVGYFSSDFKQHPLAYLIQSLFSLHDREKFEVFCYATTQGDGSHYRTRISQECEHFIEVWQMADVEMGARANADGINILVDLNGYTAGGKTEVFHMGAAPVQVLPGVSYFGTMGGDAMHSYISDRIGTPPEHACTQGYAEHCQFKEKMIYLPNSYQMNDHKQSLYSVLESGPLPRSKVAASHPMPEDAFVYVNFNSYQKIEPQLFEAWMDIISNVEGSVLWLLQFPPEGERRIRKTWEQRGLATERLLTSGLTDPKNNLERMGAADLHLDTLLYNGHTTTTDSLWAGVPVLTKPGWRHSARVAASSAALFHSVPHMAVPTLEAYVEQATALGRRPWRNRAAKAKLQEQRVDSPLFDTQRWVRDMEVSLTLLWDAFQATREVRVHLVLPAAS